jgi:hypothetical protein
MAQRDSSLRRTDLVAIGGEADMPRASEAGRSDEIDPSATLAVRCGNGFDARFEPIKVRV